jgi:hypothetical protein
MNTVFRRVVLGESMLGWKFLKTQEALTVIERALAQSLQPPAGKRRNR